MGACLLQMHPDADNAVESRLHQLTFEAIRLVGRRLRLNPSGHRALISSIASPAQAAAEKLQPQYYIHLLVSLLPRLPVLQSYFSKQTYLRSPTLSHVSRQVDSTFHVSTTCPDLLQLLQLLLIACSCCIHSRLNYSTADAATQTN